MLDNIDVSGQLDTIANETAMLLYYSDISPKDVAERVLKQFPQIKHEVARCLTTIAIEDSGAHFASRLIQAEQKLPNQALTASIELAFAEYAKRNFPQTAFPIVDYQRAETLCQSIIHGKIQDILTHDFWSKSELAKRALGLLNEAKSIDKPKFYVCNAGGQSIVITQIAMPTNTPDQIKLAERTISDLSQMNVSIQYSTYSKDEIHGLIGCEPSLSVGAVAKCYANYSHQMS